MQSKASRPRTRLTGSRVRTVESRSGRTRPDHSFEFPASRKRPTREKKERTDEPWIEGFLSLTVTPSQPCSLRPAASFHSGGGGRICLLGVIYHLSFRPPAERATNKGKKKKKKKNTDPEHFTPARRIPKFDHPQIFTIACTGNNTSSL
ncbi:hypothetical protein BP00DRAFT_22531 [Aspergillus indologenus CBS 114.80]|uniref:Uncharacterized protein n=1 Tax=Aspergillus indologenus CBS 114.80 TaxID=1450541 RepID=A0A2V5HSA6_9EURO|nr:hypothetical protein BP00DRAFT_22531 [Aspergillus indologenus CBS 114.80]